MDAPQIITHAELSLNHSLFDVKWIPCSAKMIVLGSKPSGTGSLEIYEMCEGQATLVSETERPNAFKCGTFEASSDVERRLATGDFKGNIEIWDLETKQQIYIGKEHTDIINSIDGMGGNTVDCGAPEIVTGSRDGTVKVWDPRQPSRPVANMCPSPGTPSRDCWCVGFGNSYNDAERVVAAGYDNGDVKMFDLRTMSLRWECNLRNGVCALEFDRKNIPMNKLCATTLEGKFHVFDLRTQNPSKGFAQVVETDTGSGTVWTCRHLPQNRDVLATCAGNGQLTIWKYVYPAQRSKRCGEGGAAGVPGTLQRLQRCAVSSQPLHSLHWNVDHTGLAAAVSFDQCLRLIIVTKLNLH